MNNEEPKEPFVLHLSQEYFQIESIDWTEDFHDVEVWCLYNDILNKFPFLQRFFKKKTSRCRLPILGVKRGNNDN